MLTSTRSILLFATIWLLGIPLLSCRSVSAQDTGTIGRTFYVKPKGVYATIDTSTIFKLRDQLTRGTSAQKAAAIKSITIAPDKYQPPIFYFLAKALMDEGKRDDAVFWFCVGQLRCRYDAQLCTDVTARSGIGAFDAMFGPVIGPYMLRDKARLANTVKKVVEWDEKTRYDYDHRWINLHGLAAMSIGKDEPKSDKPLSAPQSEWPTIAAATRKKFLAEYQNLITQKGDLKGSVYSKSSDTGQIGRSIYAKSQGVYASIDTGETNRMREELLGGTPAQKAEAIKAVTSAPQKYQPPVFYYLCKALLDEGKRDDAVFWYCVGHLRAQYDAQLCTDVSARAAVGLLDVVPLLFVLEDKDKLATTVKKVVEWDQKIPYEYDHRWINLRGPAAWSRGDDQPKSDKPLSAPMSEWPTIAAATRKKFLADYKDLIWPPVKPDLLKDAKACDQAGVTGLMQVAQRGDLKVAMELILKGADINAVDKSGYSPLLYALGRSQGTLLMTPPSKPSYSSEERATALHLIAKHADVTLIPRDGYTPLSLAALGGDVTLVRALVSAGAAINCEESKKRFVAAPLTEAAKGGNADVAAFLLKNGADVNGGHKGYQSASGENTPLMSALAAGNVEVAKLLLSHGAKADVIKQDGTTAAMVAAGSKHGTELLQVLMDAGVNISGEGSYGQTVISQLASRGSVATLKMLMAKGSKIDPKGKSGQRALWSAVIGKNPPVLKFLIDKGVDPNMVTPRGESLLVEASKGGQQINIGDVNVVRILLDAGVAPNDMEKSSETPLIAAASMRNQEIVELLLKRGANPNALNRSGERSALLSACIGGFLNVDIVKALLNAGADVNVREGYDHKTALEYVAQRTDAKSQEIAALLRSHGAK